MLFALTFPSPLEKEPHNKNLQPRHTNHQTALNYTEIEYPALRALNGAEITVFARAKVLLVAVDCREIAGDFHDRFF